MVFLFSDGLLAQTLKTPCVRSAHILLVEFKFHIGYGLLRRFKTTRRTLYNQAWQTAETQGAFDSLFFNSDGILLEGGRSNVFVKYQGQWLTPSLDLDILNGVMRQAVLQHPQTYLGADTVIETHITRDILEHAEEIRLSNALRSVFEADLVVKE